VETVRAPHRTFSYSAFHPLNSLRHAIESTVPDLILPCDDRAVQHLQELSRQFQAHGEAQDMVAGLIERSLGPPASYSIVSARYDLLQLAQAEGIRVPTTCLLQTAEDLARWETKQTFPWVLKADGTWGGCGVRIAKCPKDAQRMLHALQSPCGLKRAIKRALVNRDSFYLRAWWQAVRPAVIAQAFVSGRPANCAVACWEGKVLAQIDVEVVIASSSTGPAKAVRRVDNPEMVRAAELIARKLCLSGLFGLDFMVETGSGATYLVEMNPRCTPLSHIHPGSGPDLVAALHARLAGRQPPAISAAAVEDRNEVIAYYPHAWNLNSELLTSSLQDFPHGEPELARALLRPFPEETLLYRIAGYLSDPEVAKGYESASTVRAATPAPEQSSLAVASVGEEQQRNPKKEGQPCAL
jgi:hypothetical protein